MPQITVYVAAWNVPGGPPPLTLSGQPLTEYLLTPNTPVGPAISMLLDFSRYSVLPPIPAFSVTQSQLQGALATLLGPLPPTPIRPVGLILTTLYGPNTATEGFMFDTARIPGAPYYARQGCALFWNAIKAAAPNPAAALERLTFQAIHELGHSLNLWHVQPALAPPNFMTAPPPLNIEVARTFIATQLNYLSHALDPANCAYVLPGGTDFGVRGPLAPSGGDVPYAVNPASSGLKLEIALSHSSFYAVEPVELDVSIRLKPSVRSRACSVPEEIDPGYSRFKVWLTLPNGEKRLYRAGVNLCVSGRRINISKKSPYRRDISIYRSAGDYTFPMPGKYAVQATYEFAPGKILRSNRVHCRVLPFLEDVESTMSVLSRPDAIRLLQFKDEVPASGLHSALTAYAKSVPDSITSAMIYYALGRGPAKVLAAGGKVSVASRDRGKASLIQALTHRALGADRALKAGKDLKRLSGK